MPELSKEAFIASLEAEGEPTVRAKIAQRLYGVHNGQIGMAQEWLLTKEHQRREEADRSSREQIDIARSAKNAAWIAAIAAIIAAIAATVAIGINPPWASSSQAPPSSSSQP